mmetsp:Transcript_14470/g.24942  ORF Transcript_14470/g.24942 Transcript_14470/m.24942 type:complete len:224 (+) Transcript_14470:52-723(+)
MGLFDKKPVAPPPPPPQEPLTVKEQVKEQKRNIDKAIRELDRERMKMEQQEKTIQAQIRKAAKDDQIDAARMMAKDLVRTRQQVKRMYQMKTQMQSISMQMTSIQSTAAMNSALAGVVSSMAAMNTQLDLPSMQKLVMEYEKQTGKMEMTQEMMDDALEGAMGVEGEELATDEVLNQVLDELGLDLASKAGRPMVGAGGSAAQVGVEDPADADLASRLQQLRQ